MVNLVRVVPLLLLVAGLASTAVGDDESPPVAGIPEPQLPMLVPAPVPGPALAHAELLAGSLPGLDDGDGSTIAEIPTPASSGYELRPEDVYDRFTTGSGPLFVLVLAIDAGDGLRADGTPGYRELAWGLVRQAPGWDAWRVEVALVGKQAQAETRLSPADRQRARRRNVLTVTAGDRAPWMLRGTLENLYVEALHAAGLPADLEGELETAGLLQAAARMAEVGRTGKDNGAGWLASVDLLDRALLDEGEKLPRKERFEVLTRLAEALAATGEVGRRLGVLAELVATQPQSARHWEQLARVYLDVLRLPEEALEFAAVAQVTSAAAVALVRGDALSALGRHAEAIAAYEPVRGSLDGDLHLGEAYLRAGLTEKAKAQAAAILARDESNPRAALLSGCAAYVLGDLPTARSAFERAASHPAVSANAVRAMACYDLGLTCLRLGEGGAAELAFLACARALEAGSPPGFTALESVSPDFGQALVAWGRRGPTALREVDTPLEDAPRCPALRLMRAALLASQADVVGALREARTCLVLAPECAYACSLCSALLARQALRAGAAPKRARELAEEAVYLSGRAVTLSAEATPFGQLLRQRDRALRGARPPGTPARGAAAGSSAIEDRRHRDAALRLLRLAQQMGPDDRVISAVYARALLTRYAGRETEDSVVGESVRHAKRIQETYAKDPAFAGRMPPMPPK